APYDGQGPDKAVGHSYHQRKKQTKQNVFTPRYVQLPAVEQWITGWHSATGYSFWGRSKYEGSATPNDSLVFSNHFFMSSRKPAFPSAEGRTGTNPSCSQADIPSRTYPGRCRKH